MELSMNKASNSIEDYERMMEDVLRTIIQPSYELPSGIECQLTKLVAHCAGKYDEEMGRQLRKMPVVLNWFPQFVSTWESHNIPHKICSFAFELLALLSKDEASFNLFHNDQLYMRLVTLSSTRTSSMSPVLKCAFSNIIMTLVNHESGLNWIASNDIWSVCLDYCLTPASIFFAQNIHNFVSDLLLKSVFQHRTLAKTTVLQLHRRLNEQNVGVAQLIAFIFNRFSVPEHEHLGYHVLQLFVDCRLAAYVRTLQPSTSQLQHDLFELFFHVELFTLLTKLRDKTLCIKQLEQLDQSVIFRISYLVSCTTPTSFIRLCLLVMQLWSRVSDEALLQIDENHVFMLDHFIPLLLVAITGPADKETREQGELVIPDTTKKMSLVVGMWHSSLMKKCDVFEVSRTAVSRIASTRIPYGNNKYRVLVIFQRVLLMINRFADQMVNDYNTETSPMNNFIKVLLDAAMGMIAMHPIIWLDTVETRNLFIETISAVDFQKWPTKVVVHALKLISVALEKFVPDDLAALMKSEGARVMQKILQSGLSETMWEIRDSTIEIVCMIAKVAVSKYPRFKQMLIDYNIAPKIIALATDDPCHEVRACAGKCVVALIELENTRTSIVCVEEVIDKMLCLLQNDSEAIVRMHAANAICGLQKCAFISREIKVYAVMAQVAMRDLNYDVQTSALLFWKSVIAAQLNKQSYVDGKFVFKRKSDASHVNLKYYIFDRVHKVLSELAENGCLEVLIYFVENRADESMLAIEIVKELKQLLVKYELFEDFENEVMQNSANVLQTFINILHRDLDALAKNVDWISNFDGLEHLLKTIVTWNNDNIPDCY